MAKNVLTHHLSEPLGSAKTAKLDINTGDGNLTIDSLGGGEPVLACGTLQYLEKQGLPVQSLDTSSGQAALSLRSSSSGQPWFHFPWAACNGATLWEIHLNPTVSFDINACSGGGNVKLNLAGMAVTRVTADTGGGNMDLVLPDHAADLSVDARTGGGNVTVEVGSGIRGNGIIHAKSGAGNVVVRLPLGIAAKIHATSGLGKVIVDPQFNKIDRDVYQSPDYDSAADKVEITVSTGAGNVIVNSMNGEFS